MQGRAKGFPKGWSQSGNPIPLPRDRLARPSRGHPQLLSYLADVEMTCKQMHVRESLTKNWRSSSPNRNSARNTDMLRGRMWGRKSESAMGSNCRSATNSLGVHKLAPVPTPLIIRRLTSPLLESKLLISPSSLSTSSHNVPISDHELCFTRKLCI